MADHPRLQRFVLIAFWPATLLDFRKGKRRIRCHLFNRPGGRGQHGGSQSAGDLVPIGIGENVFHRLSQVRAALFLGVQLLAREVGRRNRYGTLARVFRVLVDDDCVEGRDGFLPLLAEPLQGLGHSPATVP